MKPILINILFAVVLIITTKTTAQNCWPATAETSLNINNVDVGLLNGGDLFWDLDNPRYEYPKGSGNNVIFSSALWMGGIDDQGTLKVAAQTYRQGGVDFFPGPIVDNEATETSCLNFDRFWEVLGTDITAFLETWEENEGVIEESDVPTSILKWPGRNSTTFYSDFSSIFTLPIDKDLAPFWDRNQDGVYNPLDGDYPVINPEKEGDYADQMVWWIFNDAGNEHTSSGGEIIGIEMGVLAYAYQPNEFLNYLRNTTFYRYTMYYNGTETLNDFYTGLFVDVDLGNFQDDFVGCDTIQNMGFAYNGDDYDDGAYEEGIPLVGVKYLSDWDGNVSTDINFSSFVYFNSDFTVTGFPYETKHYHNYMKALWLDDSQMTFGGNGYGGSEPSNYTFPSDPTISEADGGWSECAANNVPADRRFLMSIGPFTLEPGTRRDMTYTVLIAPPAAVQYPCPSIDPLRDLGNEVDQLYYDKYIAPSTWAVGLNDGFDLKGPKAYPNPTTEQLVLEWDKNHKEEMVITIFDIVGKELEQVSSNTHRNKIDVSSWNTGMYFYEIANKEGQVLNTGKFLVE